MLFLRLCALCVVVMLNRFYILYYERLSLRASWAISPLPNSLLNSDDNRIWDWFMAIKSKASKEDLELFVCTCWSIWRNRNNIVHEGKRKEPASTIQFASNYLQQVKEAQNPFSQPRPPESQSCWVPPEAGIVKINFDASVLRSPLSIGLGAVARNQQGDVIAWSRRKLLYLQQPELAEALAARLAADLAQRLQVRQAILEGDCITVIKSLQSSRPCLSAAGVFIDEIKSLVRVFDSLNFSHVSRQCNTLAHQLARGFSIDSDGGPDLPSDILMQLCFDL